MRRHGMRAEVARAAVYAAGVTPRRSRASGDLDRAVVGRQASLADEAGDARTARTCVQVHGGMGYTWEVDAHLYLKRAWVLATQFGTADEHAERLAALV